MVVARQWSVSGELGLGLELEVRVRVRLGVDTLGLGTVSKCSVLYLTVWP